MHIRLAVMDDVTNIAEIHVLAWRAAYIGLMSDELLDSLSIKLTNVHMVFINP